MSFPHEKLHVYQETLLYVSWVARVLRPELKGKDHEVSNQIARASRSIGANIAEGVGRWLPGDKKRFYQFAQGSCAECAATMDLIKVSGFADETTLPGWNEERERLNKIGAFLAKLIQQTEARLPRKVR